MYPAAGDDHLDHGFDALRSNVFSCSIDDKIFLSVCNAQIIVLVEDTDVADVIALWQRCDLTRPWNDPAADIALARKGQNATVLVGRDGSAIVTTALSAMTGIAAGSITSRPIPDIAARAMAAPS